PVAPATGYRAHAHVMTPFERGRVQLYDVDLLGRADAPEPPSHTYHEFATYQMAVYSRGDMMYGMLRDIIGDSAFTAFLHDYYARWKFKHVDELAMEASAERVSGRDLGWFFSQWVHHTGLVDYALSGVKTRREGNEWVTRAQLVRRGEFRHPMPVGAKTLSGWTIVRGDAAPNEQWVEIHTAERPSDVRVDPLHSTEDWDRRNDVHASVPAFDGRATMYTFDWPFLAQSDRNRTLAAVGPKLWYTGPGGATGAVRVRSSYVAENGVAWDQRELGLALSSRVPVGAPGIEHLQGWVTLGNPGAPVASRSSAGATVGAWFLDGITKFEAAQNWNLSPFLYSNGADMRLRVAVVVTLPYVDRWIDS
ncbi:MAG: M1 family aminopeptidase, partial [Gemmatimonadales bacterium]